MTNYQVTIGYKAVINVYVAAESRELAEKLAMEIFKRKVRDKINTGKITLEDDSYGPYGILDMDKTWNEL